MSIILFNFLWMTVNILLAVIAIVFGWLFYATKNKFLKLLYFIVWFFFLPNTLYLFSDYINLVNQWGGANTLERIVFVFQYSVLVIAGFVTLVLALYPFEKQVKVYLPSAKEIFVNLLLIFTNLLVGFGIILGRVMRVNSWEVVTNIPNVINSSISVLISPELILQVILYALLANFSYFLLRGIVLKYFKTLLIRAGVLW